MRDTLGPLSSVSATTKQSLVNFSNQPEAEVCSTAKATAASGPDNARTLWSRLGGSLASVIQARFALPYGNRCASKHHTVGTDAVASRPTLDIKQT